MNLVRKKQPFTPRCKLCGRFVNSSEVRVIFTPDTHFTHESTEWVHYDCRKPFSYIKPEEAR